MTASSFHNPTPDRHQAARDAAAELAYPDDRHGRKTGIVWGDPIKVQITGRQDSPDMSWSDGTGHCNGVNPDVFFPARGEDTARAKAICDGCPLLEPCREHGIAHETVGIWGGLSERERRLERAKRGGRQVGRPIGSIIHGTRAGYSKHRRHPELFGEPCEPCREAMGRDMRARRAQRVAGDVTGAQIIDMRRGA